MGKIANTGKEIEAEGEITHHAYLVLGGRENAVPAILGFIQEKFKIKKTGNPDFWMGEFETMGIDESRTLKEAETRKSFGGGKKIFLITAGFITRETQNSLLKMLEEPRGENIFFLAVPSKDTLLPALCSRLADFPVPVLKSDGEDGSARKFLKQNLPERLKFSKKMAEDISEGNAGKQSAVSFLNGLESIFRRGVCDGKFSRKDVFSLSEILKCKSYLSDRAPSVKMILEHIALILPL